MKPAMTGNPMDSIGLNELDYAIRWNGLSGAVICLHSSLKSFGRVEGGAETVLQAFLQNGCTLLVPAFTYDCEVPIPEGHHLARNAYNPHDVSSYEDALGYDPSSDLISPEMGQIPARLLALPGHLRGAHPLNSFAALGPRAEALIRAQAALNVYGPYKVAFERENAFLVLAGVDLTSATPLHYAEERAGRRLFRRWAKLADGSIIETEVGSCSDGFNRLLAPLHPLETQARVGQSLWRIYPLRPFIETASAVIRRDPEITRCIDPFCQRCADAIAGGPLLPGGSRN
jgi:aminoglycoside 3-N-acetyltransferase